MCDKLKMAKKRLQEIRCMDTDELVKATKNLELSEKKTLEALRYFHFLVYEENNLKSARELYRQFHEETKSRVKSDKRANVALRVLSFASI